MTASFVTDHSCDIGSRCIDHAHSTMRMSKRFRPPGHAEDAGAEHDSDLHGGLTDLAIRRCDQHDIATLRHASTTKPLQRSDKRYTERAGMFQPQGGGLLHHCVAW